MKISRFHLGWLLALVSCAEAEGLGSVRAGDAGQAGGAGGAARGGSATGASSSGGASSASGGASSASGGRSMRPDGAAPDGSSTPPANLFCTDGLRNGSESDVDCGGTQCAGCGEGAGCAVGDDCVSGTCTDAACCVPVAACPAGLECGVVDDGCGGTFDCGGCSTGASCIANACVSFDEVGPIVSVGMYHSCAVGSDRVPYCWGYNLFGRLGDGTTTNRNTAVGVSGLGEVAQVSNHGLDDIAFGCALRTDGQPYCWGNDRQGQLGDGGATTGYTNTPVVVVDITDGTQLSSGNAHSCVRRDDGSIACWGDRANGRLGDGGSSAGSTDTPVAATGITTALQVSAGFAHTCAVLEGGSVQCWGDRSDGRLGDGGSTAGDANTAVAVEGVADAVLVSAGWQHTCALGATGSVRCWGNRGNGRLGDGGATTGSSTTPVEVSGLSDAIHVSAGRQHSCAVRAGGEVVCWGNRANGRLGNGSTAGTESAPVAVDGITDAVQVSAGYWTTCAATAAGQVWCWGYNALGMLGDGTTTQRSSPVQVQGLP